MSQIKEKLPHDKRKLTRDSVGNAITIEDPVKVNNKQSGYYDMQGIIKSIVKNSLFMWNKSLMNRTNGIFVEQTHNVLIEGAKIFKNEISKHVPGVANQNKIRKHKLINQPVIIIRGPMKGKKGRVTHVNDDTATLEIPSSLKKIYVLCDDLEAIGEIQDRRGGDFNQGGYDRRDQQQIDGDKSVYGGQTTYGGGQTEYGGIVPQTPGAEFMYGDDD